MAQRLQSSASQYLRQHSHQQVDWYPYSDEAFEQARLRDVPVMLSIGYSACHWCHVMSHESFDDPHIADLLNENFVSIKVDREEHPLVDDTYMMATQALTGAGGWPMTIFALPDGRTFQAGTYYPPTPRGKTPSFTQVLNAVHDAWETRRSSVEEQADMLAAHLADLGSRQNSLLELRTDQTARQSLAAAANAWAAKTRPEGGMSPAPKFPATWALKTMWRSLQLNAEHSDATFDALASNIEAIINGGLNDHVGGGFARYCVDENWSVPHFEKMLYDNAGLLSLCARTSVLAQEYVHTASQERKNRALLLAKSAQQAALDTAAFLEQTMLTGNAGDQYRAFASSLDADSEREGQQVEGAFYTYTRNEINAVLAQLDALPQGLLRLAEVAEDPGHFHLSMNRTLQHGDVQDWEALRTSLLEVRSQRPRPGRDEKIIAGWNGLAVEALGEAAVMLDAPHLTEMAGWAATTLWEVHFDQNTGQLARVSFNGRAEHSNEATLQDYAATALGFMMLATNFGTGSDSGELWLKRAELLLERAAEFVDSATGTPRDAVALDSRLDTQRRSTTAASILDDALPSSAALYAKALARHAMISMADGDFTPEDAAGLEAARAFSAHAAALAAEAGTQVATALEVYSVLNADVHYVGISDESHEQAQRLRRLCMALGIEYRRNSELQMDSDSLRIQPCREELCQLPVAGVEEFLDGLRDQ